MKKILFAFVMTVMPMTMMAIDINRIPVVGYVAENWTAIDSSYVEPTLYDYSVQIVEQNNQEQLYMETEDGMKVKVRSPFETNLGAGVFWQWIGTNFTFGLKHNQLMDGTKKTQFSLNIFSQLFNINFQYRKTGGDFTLKQMETPLMGNLLDFDEIVKEATGKSLGFKNMQMGQDCSIKMFNLEANYIWNHKKFSYSAAQSFSRRQIRSAGSLITGLAYTHYDIKNDFAEFQTFSSLWMKDAEAVLTNPEAQVYNVIRDAIVGSDTQEFFGGKLCSDLHFSDLSLNIGYAYNWVPCQNFLISGAATISPAMKVCKGDNYNSSALAMFKGTDGNDVKTFIKSLYTEDEYANIIKTQDYQDAMRDIDNNLTNAYNKTKYSFNKTRFDFNGNLRLAAVWSNARWYAGAQFILQYYRYHTGLYTKFDNMFFNLNFTVGLRLSRTKEFRKGGKYEGKYPDPAIF